MKYIEKSGHSIHQAFQEFHKKNPHVYDLFRQMALYLIQDKGKKNIGAKMIIELIRWKYNIKTVNNEFKIDNNFTSFYVRMFVKEYSKHNDCFIQKKSQADQPVQIELF